MARPRKWKRRFFYELYGHAATSSLFGGEWLAKQNALLDAIGGGEGLYRLAASHNIDLHAYAAGLMADASLNDAQRSAIMMDELLAHMAEKKTVLRRKINEFLGAVRACLRDHGFAKLAEYGNTDLAHLLATARKSLAAKAAGGAGPAMPVFARDADHAPMFYSALARLPTPPAPKLARHRCVQVRRDRVGAHSEAAQRQNRLEGRLMNAKQKVMVGLLTATPAVLTNCAIRQIVRHPVRQIRQLQVGHWAGQADARDVAKHKVFRTFPFWCRTSLLKGEHYSASTG